MEITLHKIKSYAPTMEITFQSMEKIKTLQEKLKTYAPLVELTIESMKNKKKNKKLSHSINTCNNKNETYMRPLPIG